MTFGGVFKKLGHVVTAPVRAVKQGVQHTMQAAILGIVRHVLTTLGGVLVANGTLTSDMLQNGIGAVVILVGIAWSVLNKKVSA